MNGVNTYFLAAVPGKIRDAILEAGGREVFFRGIVDENRRVQDVEVLARGSREAVPAVAGKVRFGDVVIHNHPEGEIHPSEADLSVASLLADLGVGFFITDNEVTDLYVVIEPFSRRNAALLDAERIPALFAPNGPVAAALEGFEQREQQVRMVEEVVRAFNEEAILAIEAGTGVGKSLAYLVPAILWSVESGERVVISTNTIPLQEQLMDKDVPLLVRALGLDLRCVLVKGRKNYVCLRKLKAVEREPELLLDPAQQAEVRSLREWAESTSDGSLSDVNFVPSSDLWDQVSCEPDGCPRLKCPHYPRCFFYRARRNAASAQVLVVNHHLLLSDLAVRKATGLYSVPAVLPPFSRIVLDEAHEMEEVATSHFGFRITRFGIQRQLARLQREKEPVRGLLPFLESKIRKFEKARSSQGKKVFSDEIVEDLLPARKELSRRAFAFFFGKLREHSILWMKKLETKPGSGSPKGKRKQTAGGMGSSRSFDRLQPASELFLISLAAFSGGWRKKFPIRPKTSFQPLLS